MASRSRFGDCLFDPRRHEVRRGEYGFGLGECSIEVIDLLIETPGGVTAAGWVLHFRQQDVGHWKRERNMNRVVVSLIAGALLVLSTFTAMSQERVDLQQASTKWQVPHCHVRFRLK